MDESAGGYADELYGYRDDSYGYGGGGGYERAATGAA
jgi:hypothetical protein